MALSAETSKLSILVDPIILKSDDTVFPFWYFTTVSDISSSASAYNYLTSLENSRVLQFRTAIKHGLFVVEAPKGTGARFFVWNPFQQGLKWGKRNAFLRQRGEYHSVVCVACRGYCCLSCVVSRLFTWNLGYKNIIDCYHTRQISVIRWRKKSCAKYNKVSIDGQQRQKKLWVKEKVNFNCHVVLPPRSNEDTLQAECKLLIGDVFTSLKHSKKRNTTSLRAEPYDFNIISTRKDL